MRAEAGWSVHQLHIVFVYDLPISRHQRHQQSPVVHTPGMRSPASVMTALCWLQWIIVVEFESLVWLAELAACSSRQCDVVHVLDVQSFHVEHRRFVVQRRIVVVLVRVVVDAQRRLSARYRTIVRRHTYVTYGNERSAIGISSVSRLGTGIVVYLIIYLA